MKNILIMSFLNGKIFPRLFFFALVVSGRIEEWANCNFAYHLTLMNFFLTIQDEKKNRLQEKESKNTTGWKLPCIQHINVSIEEYVNANECVTCQKSSIYKNFTLITIKWWKRTSFFNKKKLNTTYYKINSKVNNKPWGFSCM